MGSSSLTRDQTWAPCIGSVEYQPLAHPGSPLPWILHLNSAPSLAEVFRGWPEGVVHQEWGGKEVEGKDTPTMFNFLIFLWATFTFGIMRLFFLEIFLLLAFCPVFSLYSFLLDSLMIILEFYLFPGFLFITLHYLSNSCSKA